MKHYKLRFLLILFVVFVILLITVSFSHAQVGEDDDEDYSDPLFYENSNPSSWDYSQVDWSLVPAFQISNIPVENIDYEQLLIPTQTHELTPAQIIANLDNINNLFTDVIPNRAATAIQSQFGITTTINSAASMSRGVLSSPNGDTINLNNQNIKQNGGMVRVTQEGTIEVIYPSNSGSVHIEEETERPETLEFDPQDVVELRILAEDLNMRTQEGELMSIQGTLRSDNGNLNIIGQSTINGVTIETYDESIPLYLQNEYSPENLRIGVTIGRNTFGFNPPENHFDTLFYFDEGNSYMDEISTIALVGDTQFHVENRDREYRVPLVNIKIPDDDFSMFLFESNGIDFSVSNDEIRQNIPDFTQRVPGLYTTSARFDISYDDGYSDVILTSPFSELYLLGDIAGQPIEDGIDSIHGVPSVFSESLRFTDLTAQDIYNRFGRRILSWDESFAASQFGIFQEEFEPDSMTLKSIYDFLSSAPQPIIDSIDDFIIYPHPDISEDFAAQGFVYPNFYNQMYLSQTNRAGYLIDPYVLMHEGIHNWHFSNLNRIDHQRLSFFHSDSNDNYLVQFPEIVDPSDLAILDNIRQSDPFTADWIEIHGEFYGIRNDPSRPYLWSTNAMISERLISIDEAAHGCFRAYGCSDVYEDVATAFENVFRDPSMYDNLISPYQEDRRYIQKLTLGQRENLLPSGWLETRMRAVGYDDSCIREVLSNFHTSSCIASSRTPLILVDSSGIRDNPDLCYIDSNTGMQICG